MSRERYTLSLIHQAYNFDVHRTVFDSKHFVTQPYPGIPAPKDRKTRMKSQVRIPMYGEVYGLINQGMDEFDQICMAFDANPLLLTTIDGRKLTVGELKALAEQAPKPGLSKRQNLDSHAKDLFGQPSSIIIGEAKNKIIERFKAVFPSIVVLPFMEMSAEEDLDMRENFKHTPVWAPDETLQELRALADQGHAYSQYLAGVLLATVVGNFSTECIPYLLAAYKQKVPDAMHVLAEFCFYKRDYFGAIQCAGLSVDGGRLDSDELIKQCFGITQRMVYEAPGGISFGSQVITRALMEQGMEPVIKRVLLTRQGAHA